MKTYPPNNYKHPLALSLEEKKALIAQGAIRLQARTWDQLGQEMRDVRLGGLPVDTSPEAGKNSEDSA